MTIVNTVIDIHGLLNKTNQFGDNTFQEGCVTKKSQKQREVATFPRETKSNEIFCFLGTKFSCSRLKGMTP